jgi:hypothetical protein
VEASMERISSEDFRVKVSNVEKVVKEYCQQQIEFWIKKYQ